MDLERQLATLQRDTSSPRAIALTRQRLLLEDDGLGLAVVVCRVLQESIDAFLEALAWHRRSDESLLNKDVRTKYLRDCLQIHLNCTRLDSCLSLELGAQGTHGQLRRIIRWDVDNEAMSEEDSDVVMELQDVACEISALYSNFPMKTSPFTPEALVERLPLTFVIRPDAVADTKNNKNDENAMVDKEVVLIHQVATRQSAQEDVGFVMWPSAVVLSRWLVSNPSILSKASRILEIGAGCGLVGLLAARVVQKQRCMQTRATSICTNDAIPCDLLLSDFNRTVLDNLERNIALNEVEDICHTVGLDFYQQTGTSQNGWKDMEGHAQAPVDVILAADMICQPSDALYAANTIHDALKPGGQAYVVCADSAHRFGVDHFASECNRVGLQLKSCSVAEQYPSLVQGDDMHKTAGFVDGMNLTMFFIEKLNQ